jgi:D-glycero-alpha-D-manno-heptose-7-phosphate kinase
MIISRTPFRVSFFGGGTDFPDFYREHGGLTLSTAIGKYCYLNVHQLGLFFNHRYRASYAKTELVDDPSEFQHPLIRESLGHLKIDTPLEIVHSSDLPGRSGLGSSSSFTVGLLNALYHFQGMSPTADTLAKDAIHIERTLVGDAGGHQDQYAAAYGGMNLTRYNTNGSVVVEPLNLSPQRRQELNNHCMLFYTGLTKAGEHVLVDQTKRIAKNTETLRTMSQLAQDAHTILTTSTSIADFGTLLHETWQLKKSLVSSITTSAIDEAYESACTQGALGGKLLGAGGRGYLLIFADPAMQDGIRKALKSLPTIDFSIADKGSEIIFNDQESNATAKH